MLRSNISQRSSVISPKEVCHRSKREKRKHNIKRLTPYRQLLINESSKIDLAPKATPKKMAALITIDKGTITFSN